MTCYLARLLSYRCRLSGERERGADQYLRTKSIKPQFPNGIVSSVSFVSTTNTARSLAGFVSLALALTPWRSRFSASIFDIPLTRGKVYRPPLDSR